jgi:uncharacterized membrane protein YphA (DoxX/SURF4 family)
MLQIFPIQFLALLAYFILRIFVGGIVLYLGIIHIRHYHEMKKIITVPWFPFPAWSTRVLIGTELIIASSLLLGAYTQLGALLLTILSIKMLFFKRTWKHHTIPGYMTYILLIGCALSLCITGAGAFAFDLPI